MRNEYGGVCYKCGLWVEPGTGYFEKIRFADRKRGDPKWRTRHCYRTHNGGVTCEMAKAAAKKNHASKLGPVQRIRKGNGLTAMLPTDGIPDHVQIIQARP